MLTIRTRVELYSTMNQYGVVMVAMNATSGGRSHLEDVVSSFRGRSFRRMTVWCGGRAAIALGRLGRFAHIRLFRCDVVRLLQFAGQSTV